MERLGSEKPIRAINTLKREEREAIQKPQITFLTDPIKIPLYDIKINHDLHLLVNLGFKLFSFLSAEDASSFSRVSKGLYEQYQEHIYIQSLLKVTEGQNWEGVSVLVRVAEPKTADECCMIAQGYNGIGCYDLVVGWYNKAIALGSVDAYVLLGMMYRNGTENEEHDCNKARRLFIQAAELGSAQGCHYLAVMYENGWGVTASTLTAMEYFQKAVDAGCRISSSNRDQLAKALFKWCNQNQDTSSLTYKYTYGTLLINGWGVPQDVEGGVSMLDEAHQQRLTKASVKLGEWFVQQYASGLKQGIPNKDDKKKAVTYLTRALIEAKNHDDYLNAFYALGCLYALSKHKQEESLSYFGKAAAGGHEHALIKMENLLLPEAAKTNSNSEKISIYSRLADVGSAEAHYQLAMLAKATGTGRITSLLEKAAKKDHVNAQYELARRYEQKADEALIEFTKQRYLLKAQDWYEKASDGGHEEASLRLGQLSTDRNKKIKYLQRAHKQGNKQAANELGDLYFQFASECDPLDNLEKAKKCYQVAVDSGYTDAQQKLEGVELNLQLHQVAHKQAVANKLGDFYYKHASKSNPIPYLEKARECYQLAVNSGYTDAQQRKLEDVEVNLQILRMAK
jgi:TPR repeat protein